MLPDSFYCSPNDLEPEIKRGDYVRFNIDVPPVKGQPCVIRTRKRFMYIARYTHGRQLIGKDYVAHILEIIKRER